MTNRYKHRRATSAAAAFPATILPGEIAVNAFTRQLALGDYTDGTTWPLIAIRFFDARAQYAAGDMVTQAGSIYRANGAISPGAFNVSQWTALPGSTDAVPEGSVNKYYTDERVDDRVGSLLVAGTNITLNYDDAAGSLTVNSTASGGSTTGEWNFINTLTTPPASGQVRLDQAVQNTATKVWINNVTVTGVDGKHLLGLQKAGTGLLLQDKDDSSKWLQFKLAADPIDGGTYWEFSVTFVQGGSPLAEQRILVAFGSQSSSDAALALKEDKANKGIANGYASLDASAKVPAAQLPSYVDDVLEFANLAAFPATGAAGIIYVALDTGKIYRWSGSAYVEISPSPGSTDAVPEGSVNKYYTDERVDDRAAALIKNGTGITWAYDDAAGTLTPTVTVAGNPPGGSNTQVQFNDSGVFGGGANLTWNKTTSVLTVTGQIVHTIGNALGISAAGAIAANNFYSTGFPANFSTSGSGGIIVLRPNGPSDSTAQLSLNNAGAVSVPGPITLAADPTAALHVATKQYVDNQDALKAPLASPVFTGNPTAPTQTVGDNDTSIATTAFVTGAVTTGDNLRVLKAGDTMTGALAITDATASTSPTTGALKVTGGVGVSGNVSVGGRVQLGPNANNYAVSDGASYYIRTNGFVVDNAAASANFLAMASTGLVVYPTTASTSSTTGALTVAGGVGIGGALTVAGSLASNGASPGSTPGLGNTSIGISHYGGATDAALIVSRAGGLGACGFFNVNGDGTVVQFQRSGATVGHIDVTTTGTAYVTSSDERLKTDLKPFDAGVILDRINVHDFAWKATGKRAYGVIAQQAVKVYPDAVSFDEERDFWGVDYSKFVPLLLQEIKDLRKRIEKLEQKGVF